MMTEKVTVGHVAVEEKALTCNVNALEKDKEEKGDLKEALFNGANGNTVTKEADGGGDTNDSYDFINENDALNGDSEEVDLDKNGNGVAEEDQAVENLEIKGEVKSDSCSINGLEQEDRSCIGITVKDKESMEPVSTTDAEDHGVSETSGANQNGATSEVSGSPEHLTKYSEAVNVLDSTSEKHTDVDSDEGNLESTDKISSIIISNGDSTNDSEEHVEINVDNNVSVEFPVISNGGITSDSVKKEEHVEGAVDDEEHAEMAAVDDDGSNVLAELPVISNGGSTNGSPKKEEHAEIAVDDEEGAEMVAVDDVGSNGLVELLVISNGGSTNDSLKKEEHAEMVVDDKEHAEMAAADNGGSNGLVDLSEGFSDINGDDDIAEVSKAVVDVNYSIQQNSDELSSGVSDINGDKDHVKITVSEAAVDPESSFKVDNTTSEVCSVSDFVSNGLKDSVSVLVSNEFHQDSDIVVVNEDIRSKENDDSEIVLNDDGHAATRIETEFVMTDENGRRLDEEVVEVENPEAFVQEEVVKNSESLVGTVENSETLVRKEIVENSDPLVEEDVAENLEVLVGKEVADIGNPDSVINQDVEADVADIGNSKGILEKEVAVAEIGNCEGILKKEVQAADPENIEPAKAAAGVENLEAADNENFEPVTAIADVENSESLVGTVENPETLFREEAVENSVSLVREEVVENSESVLEEDVTENSAALVEKGVSNIGNPEPVIDQDVEVDFANIGNSEGILEKNVEVAGIGNCEGILKKEVKVADLENLEPAKAAADIENSEPVTAIADNGNLNRKETVENSVTDVVVADIVNPEEASTIDNDSGACSIQFGSFGEPVDEVVVSKSPFSFLIRVPRCDDEILKEKIRVAQTRVDEKTQSRDAIRIEMQAKRATCKDYGDNFEDAKSQERAARDLLKSKRQEIDSIQSVINIEDIDGRIRNMEHMIQHETMPLKEEKQFIREIKQLKQVREQLSSTMGRNDEVQQGSDQKEQIEKQMKSLKKEVDQLRVELLKAEAITKAAKKRYYDETEKLKKLLSQFKAADVVRQEAYVELQSLKKQSYEKSKHYWQYRDDSKKANDLSLKGDKEALQNLCLKQVESFMDLWNNNDEFRKEYVRCNIRSTLRRLRTLDGRALGPDEQPPVIPQAANERVGKDHSLQSETQTQEKVVPVNVVKSPFDERIQEKVVLAQAVKSVAASATASTAIPLRDAIEEVTDEKTKKFEEEEVARKVEKLRKEEEEIKLREQRRLEEITKAKEAQERKKRMAEKAQARAAQRAQKEAEHKEKEREKRVRKKERRKLAATEAVASDVAVTSTDSTPETQPVEIAKESGNKDKTVAVAKRTLKASQFTKAKSIPPPPLRNRSKRRMQPWMWVLLFALIIFTLFLIGNSNFFNLGMQRFNF